MLAGQFRCKETGGVVAFGNADEARHAVAHLAANGIQLRDGADGGIELAQARERIFPHGFAPGIAKAQDRVEQRAALQAERPPSGAQGAKINEAANELPVPAENVQTGTWLTESLVVFRNDLGGMSEVGLSHEVVILPVIPTVKDDREPAAHA